MSKIRAGLLGFLLCTAVYAATFPLFGPVTGILKGNANSPQTSAATSTDVIGLWSGTCNSSSVLKGDGSCGAVTPSGAALTKTDDTNVTLTLGGSPSTALLNASSLTLGWTGTLAASRGGLGISTVTDDTVAVANGTGWVSTAVPSCADSGGNHLNYSTSTNAFSCGTSSSSSVSGANPSASVGLSAVNGSAGTFMRSDGAPALSQSISPTWTGNHTFTPASGNTAVTAGNFGVGTTTFSSDVSGSNTMLAVKGIASSAIGTVQVASKGTTNATRLELYASDGSADVGLYSATTNTMSFATANSVRAVIGSSGGITVGSPTGGNQGNGTINATGLYINGVSVSGGATTTSTFTATLTGVSGTVTCTLKYRKTGSQVSLFVNAGGTCTGGSNATTFTFTGLPAAIQTSDTAVVVGMCSDNGLDVPCAAQFAGASGTVTFFRMTGTSYSSTGWTNSGTKGFTTSVFVYDLRN